MLTLTDDKLLKFVLIWGKVVLRLFGEKSWVVPEPFLSYYSSRNAAHPVSSGICKFIKINNARAVFSGHNFIPGKNSLEIWNFQKINPLEEIKVGQRFVFEFWPHNIAPRIGMLLKGLFSPSKSPRPTAALFPFDFFSPIPCPQVPKNGGGR